LWNCPRGARPLHNFFLLSLPNAQDGLTPCLPSLPCSQVSCWAPLPLLWACWWSPSVRSGRQTATFPWARPRPLLRLSTLLGDGK
jgi:hypothetical protein